MTNKVFPVDQGGSNLQYAREKPVKKEWVKHYFCTFYWKCFDTINVPYNFHH